MWRPVGLAAPLTVLFLSGAPQPRSPSIRFVDSGQRLGSSNSYCVELADLDGDGDLDAFVANNTWQGGDGANRVWICETTRIP